jgi:hypothetical protein
VLILYLRADHQLSSTALCLTTKPRPLHAKTGPPSPHPRHAKPSNRPQPLHFCGKHWLWFGLALQLNTVPVLCHLDSRGKPLKCGTLLRRLRVSTIKQEHRFTFPASDLHNNSVRHAGTVRNARERPAQVVESRQARAVVRIRETVHYLCTFAGLLEVFKYGVVALRRAVIVQTRARSVERSNMECVT